MVRELPDQGSSASLTGGLRPTLLSAVLCGLSGLEEELAQSRCSGRGWGGSLVPVIVPLLQVRKLRLREIKSVAQDPTGRIL